jgi:hypothetical protein
MRRRPCLWVGLDRVVGRLANNVGPSKEYRADDRIVLAKPARDFVSGAQEVGKSLGYNVSGVSQSTNSVTLSRETSPFRDVVLSRVEYTKVVLTLAKSDREIDIEVHLSNLDYDGQQAGQAILNDFKTSLARRF